MEIVVMTGRHESWFKLWRSAAMGAIESGSTARFPQTSQKTVTRMRGGDVRVLRSYSQTSTRGSRMRLCKELAGAVGQCCSRFHRGGTSNMKRLTVEAGICLSYRSCYL